MKIKICGIKTENELEIMNAALPDFIGFVFAKTKRCITPEFAHSLKKMLRPEIKAVGVFVDTPIHEIINLQTRGIFDIAQLHGEYSENDILNLRNAGIETIKVIRVQEKIYEINTSADYILFDTFSKTRAGGTNKQFDWNIDIKSNVPFFVAGGINSANIKTMAEILHPFAADISSGVEENGFKTKEKVFNIIKTIKEINL